MKIKTQAYWIIAAFSLNLLSGCATVPGARGAAQDPVSRVWSVVRDEKAGDARYWKVRGREFLVFDADLKSHFAEYPPAGDVEAKRAFVLDIVSRAKELGDTAAELQLKRVPAENLASRYPAEAGEEGTAHERLLAAYKRASSAKAEAEAQKVQSMKDAAEIDRYRSTLESGIESSIKTKGRSLRQILLLPFSPFVNAWMGFHILSTPHQQGGVEYAEVDLYEPPTAAPDTSASSDDGLLRRFAPAIAVEKKENTGYDPKSDRFGNIVMEGPDIPKAQPKVDTDDPVVYGYAETKMIQGAPVKRLVYTLWFPERPNIKGGFDPEVGSTQGAILRITLDAENRPVIYENVSSCGCYYKIFPTERLESKAAERFGAPLEGKKFSVENKVPGKIDANVPLLVPDSAAGSVTVFFSAGTHEIMDIRPALSPARAARKTAYRLLPYEALENLPFNGGTISLFGEDGLVRNAARLESTLLAASGMYAAGTPRQRGTLMIYFDQADFDDPKLLETYLRLPDHAFRSPS